MDLLGNGERSTKETASIDLIVLLNPALDELAAVFPTRCQDECCLDIIVSLLIVINI